MGQTEKQQSYQNVNYHSADGKTTLVAIEANKSGGFEIIKNAQNGSNGSHLHIIPAMVDMKAYLGEPGDDLAETIETAAKNAAKSGFQKVAIQGNAYRLLKNKEDIQFVKNEGNKHHFEFLPVGSILQSLEKEQMSSLFEMHTAGAVAFTNPKRESVSAGLMQRAQQYISTFDGLLMSHALEGSIKVNAPVAETAFNTKMGFNGSPAIAEAMNIERDIAIASYNCAALHISGVSTVQGLAAIKAAKKNGIAVTCDVSIFSLCFIDEDLGTFDSNLKLFPYLRDKQTQKALFAGLKDGTIDAIASYHQPKVIEHKHCEFDFADFGAISWQTFIPLAIEKVIDKIGWDRFVKLTYSNPANILKTKSEENYVLIDTALQWDYNEKTNLSLSNNSPLFHKKLKGAVLGKLK